MDRQSTNIVLVFCDSLRFDGLGCYGNERALTPNIDALATDGLVFERCYSTSPLCVPARSQLLTGMYCHETGNLLNPAWRHHTNRPVEVDGVCIAPDIPTLPRLLTEHDYFTGHIGKNHFYPRHNQYGFHHMEQSDFYGRRFHEIDDYYLFLKERGYEHLCKDAFGRVDEVGSGARGTMREEFGFLDRLCPYVSEMPADMQVTPWTGERASEFVRSVPKGMPFFLTASFYAPHDPYCVSSPNDSLIDWQEIEPLPIVADTRPSVEHVGEQSLRQILPEDMRKKNIAHYLANVSLIDREVGRMVDSLKEKGVYENTLIIITSDHGDTLGEHRIWGKNLFYESCARIPLVCHHGGGLIAVGRTGEIATLLDIFPTVLEQAGAALPDVRLGGRPMTLDRICESDDRTVIGELANSQYPQYAVWQGNWKLIYLAGHDLVELYDIGADPHECVELSSSKPEVVKQLRGILDDWLVEADKHTRPLCPGAEDVDLAEECRLSYL